MQHAHHRDDTRSFVTLRQLWNDLVDHAADPHDIVRRWRLSEEHPDNQEMADWLERCWTVGCWKPIQKDQLLFAADALVNAEAVRAMWKTRPFRNAVSAIVTLALYEGRQALHLNAQHAPTWRDPWGPIERLIAHKVDYVISAIDVATTMDRAMAVRIARAALDQVRATTPAFGEPGHISNARIGRLAWVASHQRYERLVDHERVIRLYGQGSASGPQRSPRAADWRRSFGVIRDVAKLMPVGTVSRTCEGPIYWTLIRSLTPKSSRPGPS